MLPMSFRINNHLADNGFVQVTTYGKSTIYDRRHVGMFFEDSKGNLRVKHGRLALCLSNSNGLMVGIRFGREVSK